MRRRPAKRPQVIVEATHEPSKKARENLIELLCDLLEERQRSRRSTPATAATAATPGERIQSASEPDVLDVSGAAELLGVGKDAIYTMCGRLEIPHRRVGKTLRFSRVALLRWLGGEEVPR